MQSTVNNEMTHSGVSPGSIFAAVVGLDARPLAVGSQILVRAGDCLEPGAVRSIENRLPRAGRASCAPHLERDDVALVEISISAGSQILGLKGVLIDLFQNEMQCHSATGVIVPEWNGHEFRTSSAKGLTVWLTGLSGAGKTTIAEALQLRLRPDVPVELLDADVVRTHLCKYLGYTREDRDENVRRLGFLAKLLVQNGSVVLVSAISPYRAVRDAVRKDIGRFIEVHVNAPLEVCESRDVKGLYKRARRGEIQLFTGLSDAYEPPIAPDVECRTDRESTEESVAKVLTLIEERLVN
jgi:adenylylsulfate kinase